MQRKSPAVVWIDTENAELAKNQIKYYTMLDSTSQEFSRLKTVTRSSS